MGNNVNTRWELHVYPEYMRLNVGYDVHAVNGLQHTDTFDIEDLESLIQTLSEALQHLKGTEIAADCFMVADEHNRNWTLVNHYEYYDRD